MKSVLRLFLSAFILLIVLPLSSSGHFKAADASKEAPREYAYVLKIDGERAQAVELSLHLRPLEKAALWDLPAVPGRERRRKAVVDVRCDGTLLPLAPGGGWSSPPGCSHLSWKVKAKKRPWLGYDAPAQEAVRDPGAPWIFLPAAALFLGSDDAMTPELLRIESPPGLRIVHPLDSVGPSLFRLPSGGNRTPAALAVGNFIAKEIEVDKLRLRYLFDRAPKADFTRLARRHAAALSRLAEILGNSGSPPEMIFWFQKSRLSFRIGGAALDRSICVNYRDGFDPDSPDVLSAAPLLVVLHEEFHLLSPENVPAWLAEGLAQYYAAKVLHQSGFLDDARFRKILDKLSGPFDPSRSLLELQKRINSSMDMNDYRLLYSLGIHFWRRMDEIIERNSNGRSSLDEIVPTLLKLPFGPGGEPSPEFRGIIARAGGEAAAGFFDDVVIGLR